MWLSATKGGTMKDTKPKVMHVTKNIRAIFYRDGEFEIRFQHQRNRVWIFKFTKFKRIKCSIIRDHFSDKPSVDVYKNYKDFRYMIQQLGKSEDIPAWVLALALWKFDRPTRTRMVEDRIGCVIFFREEEY